MWGLLREAWEELVKSWLALVQCFLIPALLGLVLGQALSGMDIEQLGAEQKYYFALYISVVFIVIGLLMASGAVRWHRHVIAGEKTNWVPHLPDGKSFMYAAKLIFVIIAFGATNRIGDSIVMDLVMPIIGLFNGGAEDGIPNADLLKVMGRAASMLAYVFLLGPWMLRLPEGSLDPNFSGARKTWPNGGKRHYLQAFTVVSLASLAVNELQMYLGDDSSGALWWALVLASFFVSAVGLSLLTVAYRRNIKSVLTD
jgi:hypothetical protein